MHAVAINGSPQEKGSTKILLDHVLKPLEGAGWSTEVVHLGGGALHDCDGCTRCFSRADGLCVKSTDAFNAIFSRMLRSNAIILGSPAGIGASLVPEVNNFINRSAYLAKANQDVLAGKVGAAVIDVPRGSFIEALDKAHRFFLRSKMVVPGVSAWNTDTKRLHEHKKGSSAETLEEMRHVGEMIDWLARAVAPVLERLPRGKRGNGSEDASAADEQHSPPAETTALRIREANPPSLPPGTYFVPPDH